MRCLERLSTEVLPRVRARLKGKTEMRAAALAHAG